MKPIYPPYDLLILGILTLMIGLGIRLIVKKMNQKYSVSLSLAFSIAYILSSVILAFVWDELPLKLYGPEKPNVFEFHKNSDGANIGAGLIGGMVYLLSVFLNFAIWGLCIFLIIRSFISKKGNNENEILKKYE